MRDLEAAGLEAAFGVVPGRVRRDSARFRLPRIEIRSGDTGFSLLLRVAFAVDLEVDWRRFRLRRWSRRLVGVVRRKRPAIG